jgi:hypothetical protein
MVLNRKKVAESNLYKQVVCQNDKPCSTNGSRLIFFVPKIAFEILSPFFNVGRTAIFGPKKYRSIQQTKDIVSITIMAWNISLYPHAEQENVQRMLVDTPPENFAGEDIGVLLTTIDELIEQKEKIYPNVREYILNHSLSFMGKNMTLVTGTAPITGEIKRKVME